MSAAGPFVLLLPTLEEGESRRQLIGSSADFEVESPSSSWVGPIVLDAVIYRHGPKIEVRGELRALVDLECDLCIRPVRAPIRAEVRIFSERRESRDRRPTEEVREDDVGIVYHDGRSIDLTEEVRQGLLLEAPWRVRCREACSGLCPRCGVDRNDEECRCGVAAKE